MKLHLSKTIAALSLIPGMALSATHDASTLQQLQDKLGIAKSGDTVRLRANLTVSTSTDLAYLPFEVPEGVILFGAKNYSSYSQLPTSSDCDAKTDGDVDSCLISASQKYSITVDGNITTRKAIVSAGAGSKIVALNLVGPDQGNTSGVRFWGITPGEQPADWNCNSTGADIEIRLNDISYFSEGIMVGCDEKMVISQNYIHHNYKLNSFGYGMNLVRENSHAVVHTNKFDYNKHDIAARSDDGQQYQAYNNHVGRNGTGHSFDFHSSCANNRCEAGMSANIYNNHVEIQSHPAANMRGIPSDRFTFTGNQYSSSNTNTTVTQRDVGDAEIGSGDTFSGKCHDTGSVIVGGKTLKAWLSGVTPKTISQQMNNKPKAVVSMTGRNEDDILFLDKKNYWRILSYSNNESADILQCGQAYKTPTTFSDFYMGDFNGDGITDQFRTNVRPNEWSVFYGEYDPGREVAEFGDATKLNLSSTGISDLLFGNFNQDNKTDVFFASGVKWFVAYSGVGNWQEINSSTYRKSNLGVGDFDGDGWSDIFLVDGGQWFFSKSGTGNWQLLNNVGTTYSISQMAFHNFDGIGADDVLVKSGSSLYISYGGTGNLQLLKSNVSQSMSDLFFADINGDGAKDILYYE